MSRINRRQMLGLGLAAAGAGAGAGAGAWALRADAQPTPQNGELGPYQRFLDDDGVPRIDPGPFEPTEPNPLGPFFVQRAPFRGKLSPTLADGVPMLISGRVWGHDTRRPLVGAVIDVWQADAHGDYDNEEHDAAAPRLFQCRARLMTDETGYYEYETIHPGPYQVGPGRWRPPHIHYMIRQGGYERLVTQLYFSGDDYLDVDTLVRDSLTIDLDAVDTPNGAYQWGVFDIVLQPADRG